MKFSKEITVNIGNYENVKLGVSDCESFENADLVLGMELQRLDLRSKAVKDEN